MASITNIKNIIFLGRQIESVQISELEIEKDSMAIGGYGKIYRIEDGLALNSACSWVVKVSLQEEKANKSGYRSMRELLSKLKEFQNNNYTDPLDMLADYPPLIGFPEALWEGELDGNHVYCYLMPDLNSLGFILFDDLITDDTLHENYIAGLFDENMMQRRFRGVYQLAKTFELLTNKFKFLHGDIKAKSVWVHKDEPKMALIDYDGGHFYNSFWNNMSFNSKVIVEVPIWGERQEWLAPEILRKINQEAETAKMEVSPESEAWSFACGTFQLLTGFSPYAFLKELQYEILMSYHKSNEWPYYVIGDGELKDADTLQFFTSLIEAIKKYDEIWMTLSDVFNKGFDKPKKRHTYNVWESICFKTIKTKEPSAKINVSEKILEGESCTLSWNIDVGFTKLNGVSVPNNFSESKEWLVVPKLSVKNEFGTWPISVPLEIVKKVVVNSCSLSEEKIKVGSEVNINWNVQNVDKIYILLKGKKFEVNGVSYTYSPDPGDIISINFISKYGLQEELIELKPNVIIPVKINFFKVNRTFTAETLPVIFSWNVEEANTIEIAGEKLTAEANTELQIRPKSSTEYKLIARNDFFEASEAIYIEVMPIPKINLKLPEMPKLKMEIPDILGSVPDIIKEQKRIRSRLKDLFGK